MIGYELDLTSPDFQTIFSANAARITAGKGVDQNKNKFLDIIQ